MNDHDPLDDHLGERMERAVGGLRAPDVVPQAIARGRRQRTRRRVAYAVSGVAAATALVLAVPAVAGDWSQQTQGPSENPVAADPTPTRLSTAESRGPGPGWCDPTTGWWSKSAEQIAGELAELLPAGTRVAETNDAAVGVWGGNLRTGDDADFTRVVLLPPPGIMGPWRTLDEARNPTCEGGANDPQQPVQPCYQTTGVLDCKEIRSESGELVGIVTEQVEHTYVDGQEQPTDRTYFEATIAVPGGGHVELYAAEGTRADRPSTVHDPADLPALTAAQVRAIVSDPVWTS